MKKFLALIFALLICISPVFADVIPVTTIISGTTVIDADPTSLTSDVVRVATGASNLAFLVTYDETETGGISAAVTLEMSFDGTTFYAASFFDVAGGATLQTTETLTADGAYYFWVNSALCAPYYRVKVTATGSDANDTAVVTAKVAARA
jgi:hypothetical protein